MGCNSSQDAKKVEDPQTNGKTDSANTENHVPDSLEKLQDISEDITPVKTEIKSVVENNEFGVEEQKAATKIQAAFRGHQVRKKFVPVDVSALHEVISPKSPSKETKEIENQIEKAKEATEQEVIMSADKAEHAPSKAELEAEFDPEDKDLCNAATKIQASFRGHQVRKQTEKSNQPEEPVKVSQATQIQNHRPGQVSMNAMLLPKYEVNTNGQLTPEPSQLSFPTYMPTYQEYVSLIQKLMYDVRLGAYQSQSVKNW